MELNNTSQDIRFYLAMAWHWAWLMALGLILGAGAAYLFSINQPPLYEASGKFMMARVPDGSSVDYYAYYSEQQSLKTYIQLLTSGPILERAGVIVGGDIRANQITVKQLGDTQLIQLLVHDNDPARAAAIANTLVSVLIDYNEEMQGSRFASSEDSLQAQIAEVEKQIGIIQSEMEKSSTESMETQRAQVETRITTLENDIAQLESETTDIQEALGLRATQFYIDTHPLETGEEEIYIPPANPTYSGVDTNQLETTLSQKKSRLNQQQSMLTLYQEIYSNLVIYGETGLGQNPSSKQEQLQNTLALYQQIRSSLLSSYENIRLARLRSTPNIMQIEQATVPTKPFSPQPVKNALLGGVVGLMLTAAVAFLIEYLDDTIRNPEDISRQLGLPLLGIIVHHPSESDAPVAVDQPRSPVTEAFRSLRTNIQFAGVDRPLTTLLVTSPSPQDGKSTVAANLAIVMAQGNRRVALIDADLRRPKVHKLLKLNNRHGMSEIFVQRQVQLNGSLQRTEVPNLAVLTSGSLPPNPAELLASEKMQEIVRSLLEQVETVVIDSPPVLPVTDATVLATRVDGVIIVVKPGVTKLAATRQAVDQLRRVNARLLGVVLNDVKFKRTSYYYYHYQGYYYYDHYGERAEPKTSPLQRLRTNGKN